MKNRKFAFMASLGYASMPPEAVCRSLIDIGYKGVEWTLSHFHPRKTSAKQRSDLVRITKDHGLEISEWVVQQDLVYLDNQLRTDRINLVLECIDAAADVGVPVINLFTGPAAWNPDAPKLSIDISEGQAWDMVLQAFETLVKAAERRQIHLAVEGVWGMLCRDFYTTRFLIDTFDNTYLGVNFDPSHDVLAGNLDVGWMLTQWDKKNRIKHIHLKDAVGIQESGKFVFPLLGEGMVDWQNFAEALDLSSYNGCMSVEFESFTYYRNILDNNAELAAKLSMQQLDKLLPDQN